MATPTSTSRLPWLLPGRSVLVDSSSARGSAVQDDAPLRAACADSRRSAADCASGWRSQALSNRALSV